MRSSPLMVMAVSESWGSATDGSIILLNDRVHAWSVSSISTIEPDDFRMFAEHEG